MANSYTWNLCSAFNPSKCKHTAVTSELTHTHTRTHTHTHSVNTHSEQWAANGAAPGEQLGVRCLARESHLSRGIEGGESAGYSLPPPTIPSGPETRTCNLRVTSPTLYPLDHDCPDLHLKRHALKQCVSASTQNRHRADQGDERNRIKNC